MSHWIHPYSHYYPRPISSNLTCFTHDLICFIPSWQYNPSPPNHYYPLPFYYTVSPPFFYSSFVSTLYQHFFWIVDLVSKNPVGRKTAHMHALAEVAFKHPIERPVSINADVVLLLFHWTIERHIYIPSRTFFHFQHRQINGCLWSSLCWASIKYSRSNIT